ncbi:MAG TPA: shikimate kinase [Candidatus Rifleibacterium sp.]|nr:shikimate kinase [Candidatus Rifleibacterium sp.]HPT47890.1 shikimate kinase [Candidatus Rifleibacterium sp.]
MKNIFLITGFMAAGKTTAVANAAARLSLPFHDLDELIEAAAAMSITEIFAQRGEDSFRQLEHQIFARLVRENVAPVIIAAGGGLPVFAANHSLMKDCCVILLDTPLPLIQQRLAANCPARPLLSGRDADAVRALWSERRPIYLNHADFVIVDGDQLFVLISKIISGAKNQ